MPLRTTMTSFLSYSLDQNLDELVAKSTKPTTCPVLTACVFCTSRFPPPPPLLFCACNIDDNGSNSTFVTRDTSKPAIQKTRTSDQGNSLTSSRVCPLDLLTMVISHLRTLGTNTVCKCFLKLGHHASLSRCVCMKEKVGSLGRLPL
jgi:hypothetical protein